jgi:hypothetical protein
MTRGKRSRKQARKEAAATRGAREDERRDAKDCYCEPGDEFCSVCAVCGKPGHLRHFPGAAPFTGSWCDFHYQRTRILHPQGTIGCWLYPVALAFLLVFLRLWLT